MRLAHALLVGFIGAAVVLLLLALGWLFLPAIGSFSPRALDYSVARKLGALPLELGATCHKRADDSFVCDVPDPAGSGGETYRVTVRGDCWTARVARARQATAAHHGCVKWKDQVRLMETE